MTTRHRIGAEGLQSSGRAACRSLTGKGRARPGANAAPAPAREPGAQADPPLRLRTPLAQPLCGRRGARRQEEGPPRSFPGAPRQAGRRAPATAALAPAKSHEMKEHGKEATSKTVASRTPSQLVLALFGTKMSPGNPCHVNQQNNATD